MLLFELDLYKIVFEDTIEAMKMLYQECTAFDYLILLLYTLFILFMFWLVPGLFYMHIPF